MARTVLTVQAISLAGLAPSYGAVDQPNGNSFANDGNVLLHFKNTGGSPSVVTFDTPGSVGGVPISNPTVTIPAATGDRMVGPFDPTVFNQSGGVVNVDYTAGTGVTVAALKLPR